MFGEGRFEVAKDKLDNAYAGCINSAVARIKKRGTAGRSPTDVAHYAAQWAARRAAKDRRYRATRVLLRERRTRLIREKRMRFISVRQLLANLSEDIFLIMIEGRTTSLQGFGELLEAANVGELLVNSVTGKTVEMLRIREVADVLPHVSAGALKSQARLSHSSVLRQGHDEALAFRELARSYGVFIKRVCGWRRAFPWLIAGDASDVALTWAAPAIAWVRKRWGRQFDEFFAQCPVWIAKFTAVNALLDYLPDDCQWRPGVWEKHTPEQAARLRRLLECFAREQPERWTAIHAEG
jgi:hypothetical protein